MHWSILAGLSALCYAFWALFLRLGTAHSGWLSVLFWAMFAEAFIVFGVTGSGAKATPVTVLWGVLAGICAAGGYMLFVYSQSKAGGPFPVVVMSLYPIVLLALSAVFLHDIITWEKWLAVGLAIVSVVLVVK